jgi:hypothetical protein
MTDNRDRVKELNDVFPDDGPHDPDTVTDAAAGVAQLVRYLNNATRAQTTLPYVSTIDSVRTAGSIRAITLTLSGDGCSR